MPPEEPQEPEPIYNDQAYYQGENYPRCMDTPDLEARSRAALIPEQIEGKWICTLPAGHEEFPDPQVHNHSWVRVSA